MADVVDQARDLGHEPPWHGFVQQTISQFCAAFFDEGQASVGPGRDGGLYASWRRYAVGDRGPALLMGVKGLRGLARDLPATAEALIPAALSALQVHPGDREDYLWSLLLDVGGWAAWCAYRRWTARLGGGDDAALVDLLAVRLAWEWLLYRLGGEATARRWASPCWRGRRPTPRPPRPAPRLAAPGCPGDRVAAPRDRRPRRGPASPARPLTLQAVFCIDVRSEVIRRALEATAPDVQTPWIHWLFGLPIEYHPLGTAAARPQLPGLLAPRLRVTDTGLTPADAARRAGRLDTAAASKALKGNAVSTFAFVEAFGLKYAVDLLKASFGLGRSRPTDRAGLPAGADPQPRLVGTASSEPSTSTPAPTWPWACSAG
ncbi:MAG: putative inorganic carbon transporter subunit DabA [bacterium]